MQRFQIYVCSQIEVDQQSDPSRGEHPLDLTSRNRSFVVAGVKTGLQQLVVDGRHVAVGNEKMENRGDEVRDGVQKEGERHREILMSRGGAQF